MDHDLLVGLVVAGVGAVLAVLAPVLWVRARRQVRGSPLVHGVHDSPIPQKWLWTGSTAPLSGQQPGAAPAGETDWRADRAAFIALGSQSMRVSLRGLVESPVIVTHIRPVVLERSEPKSGWYIVPGFGGGLPVHTFIADLDAKPPVARICYLDGDGEYQLQEAYAFKVSHTDVEYLEVQAFTTTGFVRWGLDIDYDEQGQHGTLCIRDDRFQVTALSDAAHGFTDHESGWREEPGIGREDADAPYWRSRSVRRGTPGPG